jgi:ribosomal protein L11 methyltransferase
VAGVEEEFALAVVDDFGPTAASESHDAVLIFFPDAARRSGARDAIAQAFPDAITEELEIDDEDWARRSQGELEPITIGSVTIVADPAFITRAGAPPPALPYADASRQAARHGRRRPELDSAVLLIPASTGFGTGHHATTRLCLTALQQIDLAHKRVLDLGTGSGVLALAARALGAREALGIDDDPDAIRAARENLSLNPASEHVTFELADLRALPSARADVITANLTGALLVRAADVIASHLVPGGVLIASGLRAEEREEVVRAFHTTTLLSEAAEDGWVGLVFRLPPEPA